MDIQSRKFRIDDDDATKQRIHEEIKQFILKTIGENDDAMLILREATNNSLLHSRGTHFVLTIARNGDQFLCEVADDGTGYDFYPILEKARKGEAIDWESDHGRGIFLIHQYTDGNVDIHDEGRVIRFSIAS